VVPAVITPAYVNAVFAVLNHVYGNATRVLVATREVTPAVKADLRAIFNDPLYEREISIAQQTVDSPLPQLRSPLGDIDTTVTRLIAAGPGCIFVQTVSSFKAVLVTPPKAPSSEFWVLAPKQPNDDPQHLNSTPWALQFNAVFKTPTTIPNQCPKS
jgi:hypothetical protein